MNELQAIIDQVGALFGLNPGVLAAALAWLLGVQTLIKLVHNIVLQPLFDRIITRIAETPEAYDDGVLYAVLKSKPYRFIAFVADVLLRIKLPSVASVFPAVANPAPPPSERPD
jgi:hypothetical protein